MVGHPVLVRPEDDPLEALKTASIYSPSVVHIEDIERFAGTDSTTAKFISDVLDALDAAGNKSAEVLTVFTTNHVDQLHRGVLRPGRLDAVISITGLDEAGYEQLIRATIKPELLDGDIEYAKVAEAMTGFLPAFVVEAAQRSLRYSITRGKGVPQPVNTEDLVFAADALRPQLELHEKAGGTPPLSTIEERFSRIVDQRLYAAIDGAFLDSEWMELVRKEGTVND